MDKIKAELIIKKKLYDDSNSFNKGYKVYACYVPQNYIEVFKEEEIVISGVIPLLNEGQSFKFILSKNVNGKYAGSYNVVDFFYDVEKITLEDVLEVLEYSTSTILKLKEVYPNLLEDIKSDKPINIDNINFNKKVLNSIIKKIREHLKAIILKNETKKIGLDLTISQANAILNNYSNVQIFLELFKQNPYKTLYSIRGFGFKTSDDIILKIYPHLLKSEQRCLAGILYVLEENEKNGSTYLSISKCFENTNYIVPESISFFKETINNELLLKETLLFLDRKNSRIALKNTFEVEKFISTTINKALKIKKNYNFKITDNIRKTIDGYDLSQEQLLILDKIQKESISILTGYAGAGKSASMYALVKLLKNYNKKFMLLAPTGRASKVLSNAVESEASTIHRMLLKNENKKELDVDFIICDEASMLDIHLLKSLLEKINFVNTSLIFICDPAQLSSVNCGNCLSDMINSKKIDVVSLNTIFRYKEGGVSYVATSVREGKKYAFNNNENDIKGEIFKSKEVLINKFGNYTFFHTEDSEEILIKLLLQEKKKFGSLQHLTILTPSNKGKLGTVNINKIVQNFINPLTEENTTPFKKLIQNIQIDFRIGDKVIQMQNDYKVPIHNSDNKTAPVFNGEDGIIIGYDEKINCLLIEFDNNIFEYSKENLLNLNLGYAITIHKSQGSTFEDVLLINAPEHTFMLSRNLLYVGVTRARGRIAHIGTNKSLSLALRKEETKMRNTFLYDLLTNKI